MLVTVMRNDDDEESPSNDENNVESYSNPAYSIELNQEYQAPSIVQKI